MTHPVPESTLFSEASASMLRAPSPERKRPSRRLLFQRAFGWTAGTAGVWLTRQPVAASSVLLLKSFVAGTVYYDAGRIKDRLRPGLALSLRRQPDNHYDGMAIEVLVPSLASPDPLRPGPAKLGYVPRVDNQAAARLMDAGRTLTARLGAVERHGFDLELEVELVG